MIEALINWIIEKFGEDARRGAFFRDISGRLDGFIWFYIGEVRDGKGEVAGRKIIAIYDDGAELREVNPALGPLSMPEGRRSSCCRCRSEAADTPLRDRNR